MKKKPYQPPLEMHRHEISPVDDDLVIVCERHGEWSPNDWWTPREITRDLEEQGFIDCPYCMAEIVGTE
jgi:uncharacterized Zn-finger protein